LICVTVKDIFLQNKIMREVSGGKLKEGCKERLRNFTSSMQIFICDFNC